MMLQRLLNTLPAVAALIGAASTLAGIGAYLVLGQFDRLVLVLIGIGLALLLMAASYYPNEVLKFLQGRSARYGSNTFAIIVIFLAIVSLVNFYSANHNYRWDLTESKTFTLSPQTLAVLSKIQSPIKVTVFNAGGSVPQYEDILKEFRRSSDKLEYQFVDPERMPAVARQYKIQRYGTTVLEYEGRRQDINGFGEQDLTSGIVKLTKGTAKKVYFLTGHGEINVESFDGTGGEQAKRALQADNYEVASLSLAATGSVPEDAAVLVIAGAKNPLLDDETKAINAYLEKGGKALVMTDPQGSASVNEIIKARGIEVGEGVVVDPASSLANQPQVPVIVQYEYSQITKDMAQMSLLPLATSLTPQKEMPKGISTEPLFKSTDNSWLETDSKAIRFDEGKDVRGPHIMAITVQEGGPDALANPGATSNDEPKKLKMRMVIFGNSVFGTNDLLRNPALGNRDLFVNSINWLAEEEELISIRAKEPSSRQIFLTGTEEAFTFYSTVVFLPLIILAIGGAVWWRRR